MAGGTPSPDRNTRLVESSRGILSYTQLTIHPLFDFNGRVTRLWPREFLRRVRLPQVTLTVEGDASIGGCRVTSRQLGSGNVHLPSIPRDEASGPRFRLERLPPWGTPFRRLNAPQPSPAPRAVPSQSVPPSTPPLRSARSPFHLPPRTRPAMAWLPVGVCVPAPFGP